MERRELLTMLGATLTGSTLIQIEAIAAEPGFNKNTKAAMQAAFRYGRSLSTDKKSFEDNRALAVATIKAVDTGDISNELVARAFKAHPTLAKISASGSGSPSPAGIFPFIFLLCWGIGFVAGALACHWFNC